MTSSGRADVHDECAVSNVFGEEQLCGLPRWVLDGSDVPWLAVANIVLYSCVVIVLYYTTLVKYLVQLIGTRATLLYFTGTESKAAQLGCTKALK